MTLGFETIQALIGRLTCDLRNLETLLSQPLTKEAWANNKIKFTELLKVSAYDPDPIIRLRALTNLRELTVKYKEENTLLLKKEAASLGILKYSRMNKEELVKAIKDAKLKHKANFGPDRQHQTLSDGVWSNDGGDSLRQP